MKITSLLAVALFAFVSPVSAQGGSAEDARDTEVQAVSQRIAEYTNRDFRAKKGVSLINYLQHNLEKVPADIYRPRNPEYLRPSNPYAPYRAKITRLANASDESIMSFIRKGEFFVIGFFQFELQGKLDYDHEQEALAIANILGADAILITESFKASKTLPGLDALGSPNPRTRQ